MKSFYLLLIIAICCFAISDSLGQTYTWKTLSTPPPAIRYDDIFFVNPQVGWAIDPFDTIYYTSGTTLDSIFHIGRVYKTIDGGQTWIIQLDSSRNHFRSLAFVDSLHGWLFSFGVFPGDVGYDSTLITETTDGGETWFTPKGNIEGDKPAGICGVRVVNKDVVYGVGRWNGPPYLLKTTNAGKTWKSIDMSGYASMLIDCHFWTVDSGIVVGGFDTNTTPLILFTSDGGEHWEVRYRGTDKFKEWCWKISFPSTNIGYVSVETFDRQGYLLKTTDKGSTWQPITIPGSFNLEGVGFINDTVGWAGGWNAYAYVTTNGGETWRAGIVGMNVNRFHFFGDSIGYCAGQSIFKLSVKRPSNVVSHPLNPFALNNYPNPFSSETTVTFTLKKSEQVTLTIYDILGRTCAVACNEFKEAGNHSIPLGKYLSDRTVFPASTYYYVLKAGNEQLQQKMIRTQ